MVADRNVRSRQIARRGNAGVSRNHNSCFANTVRLSPHHAIFNLRRLVYRPMTCAANVAGAFTLASMALGVAFERPETVVLERHRQIHAGELGRVFAASLDIELVVETFLAEIALFVGDPIVEPAMRLNNEFRHSASPL